MMFPSEDHRRVQMLISSQILFIPGAYGPRICVSPLQGAKFLDTVSTDHGVGTDRTTYIKDVF